jgi:hypothetical protein
MTMFSPPSNPPFPFMDENANGMPREGAWRNSMFHGVLE